MGERDFKKSVVADIKSEMTGTAPSKKSDSRSWLAVVVVAVILIGIGVYVAFLPAPGEGMQPLLPIPGEVPADSHCFNLVQDADETNTDCGGVDCIPCNLEALETIDYSRIPSSVTAVGVNGRGDLYVLDELRNRVLVYNQNLVLIDVLGEYAVETGFISGGEGEYRFETPIGMTVSANGNVYVIDRNNNRLKVYDNRHAFLGEIARDTAQFSLGEDTQGIVALEDGSFYVATIDGEILHFNADLEWQSTFPASNAGIGLSLLRGIAVASNGDVLATDSGNDRVVVFDNSGNFKTSFGERGIEEGQFRNPYGIAVSRDDSIYVVDNQNHRVQQFDAAYNHVATLGGISPGDGPGQFFSPTDIAVAANGRVYVADRGNTRVRILGSGLNVIQSLAGEDYSTYSVSFDPEQLFIDAQDNKYIAEARNNRVVILDADNRFKAQLGTGAIGFRDYEFNSPQGVTVGGDGRIYVADTGNHRVQVYDASLQYTATLGGTYGTGDTEFREPISVAVAENGNIYVADVTNARVQVFTSDYQYLETLNGAENTTAPLVLPRNVHATSDGLLLVSDVSYDPQIGNNRIFMYHTEDNRYERTITLDSFGVEDIDGSLTTDPQGRVFIPDLDGEKFWVFNAGFNLLDTIEGASLHPDSRYPRSAAIDPSGNIYLTHRAGPPEIFTMDSRLNLLGSIEAPLDPFTGQPDLTLAR